MKQPRILALRHAYAPMMFGCRWCGVSRFNHGVTALEATGGAAGNWVRSKGFHAYEKPTQAQRDARYAIRKRDGNDWDYPATMED